MTTDHKSRGPYAGGIATREAILETTVRLIGDNGYTGLSLRDVGRTVGISHPAVIYHFPSKEALLMAVIERMEKRMGIVDARPLEGAGEWEWQLSVAGDSLAQLAITLMAFSKRDDVRQLIDLDFRLAAEAASPSHPAHRYYQRRFNVLWKFLCEQLAAMAAKGSIHLDVSVNTKAIEIVNDWYSLALTARYDNQGDREPDVVPMYLAVVAKRIGLRSEAALEFVAGMPEELADVVVRAVTAFKELQRGAP